MKRISGSTVRKAWWQLVCEWCGVVRGRQCRTTYSDDRATRPLELADTVQPAELEVA